MKDPDKKKSTTFLMKINPAEKAIFEARAKELDLSLAEFLLGCARYSCGFPEEGTARTHFGNFNNVKQDFPYYAYMSHPRPEDLPPRKPFQPIPRHLLTPA